MDRRTFLGIAGAAGISLAGCVSGSSPDRSETAANADTPVTSATDSETGASATETAASRGGDTETPVFPGYDTVEVRVRSEDGEQLGAVTAAISDTQDLRYRGLSDTESLPEDRGMLFVYESAGKHTFVMREMDFGIDIVYADADGTITSVHHAPAPGPDEDGNEQRYPGYGQYVLEVSYEWTTERDVGEGDVLEFTLPD